MADKEFNEFEQILAATHKLNYFNPKNEMIEVSNAFKYEPIDVSKALKYTIGAINEKKSENRFHFNAYKSEMLTFVVLKTESRAHK